MQINSIEEIKNNNYDLTFKDVINSLINWYDYIKSKSKILVLFFLIGLSTGYIINFLQKPNYKATLTFALEDDKASGSLGGAAGIASSLGIDLGSNSGGVFAANNIMELMQSRFIIEKTLLKEVIYENKNTTLANVFIENNEKLKEQINEKQNLKGIIFEPKKDRSSFLVQQDSLLYVIYKKIISENIEIIQKNKKVSILTLNIESKNSFFAKNFCELLAKEVSDFYIKTKSQKARYNVDILQKQVDSVKNELSIAINGVASETDNVFNLNPSLNLKGTTVRRKQIDVQGNTSILTQLVAQLELAKVNLRKETPLIQIIDTPIYPLDNINHGRVYWMITMGFVFIFLTLFYLIIKRAFQLILL